MLQCSQASGAAVFSADASRVVRLRAVQREEHGHGCCVCSALLPRLPEGRDGRQAHTKPLPALPAIGLHSRRLAAGLDRSDALQVQTLLLSEVPFGDRAIRSGLQTADGSPSGFLAQGDGAVAIARSAMR